MNFTNALKKYLIELPRPLAALMGGAILTVFAVLLWPQESNHNVVSLSNTDVKASEISNELIINLELPKPAIQSLVSNPGNTLTSIDQHELTIKVKSGDTLGELFTKNKLSYSDMLAILKDQEAKKYLTRLKPNEQLMINTNGTEGKIENLVYQVDIEKALNIQRQSDNSFVTTLQQTPLEKRVAYAHGVIKDSLFLAGMNAGLEDSLIMNLAGIFQWDIDFVQDIRKGDSFTVIYEQLWKNGEYIGNSNILAAEFNNKGDAFHAIRFVDENDDGNYYAPSGKSMKKAFLRAPIAFSPRVTSSFNPKRYHPVHKKVRPHRGVDYGGPLNTPILAAGDGKVIFRGRKGGYGKTVILQHGGNITTLYAHLNKFNSKVKNGTRVKQGQTIGYLGATGTVTAKHLHYEYRLNGAHRNPRTVKLPNAKALPKKYKDEFDGVKQPLLAQLDVIKRANTVLASKPTATVVAASAGASSAIQ